jgi:hypothetical protein
LEVAFDVELGELVPGHRVVARGILFGRLTPVPRIDPYEIRALMKEADAAGNGGGFHIRRPGTGAPREHDQHLTDAELHYEFVPGLSHAEAAGRFDWGWRLSASDDVGTGYDNRDSGAFDGRAGLAAAHGTRDLGGQIPPEANLLTLRFEPSGGWTPPEPWCQSLIINLRDKRLDSTTIYR